MQRDNNDMMNNETMETSMQKDDMCRNCDDDTCVGCDTDMMSDMKKTMCRCGKADCHCKKKTGKIVVTIVVILVVIYLIKLIVS